MIPSRRRLIRLSLVLVPLAIAGALVRHGTPGRATAAPAAPAAAKGVPVTTAQAGEADFPVRTTALGAVQALETAVVTSQVDGVVTRVLFEQGQLVKKGDPLVEIDGEVPRTALDKAVARRDQDQVRLENERRQLERLARLAENHLVADEALERQRTVATEAGAVLRQDEAELARARIQLARTTVRAPFSGQAGFRLVDAGNAVHAGVTPVVKISRVSPVMVVYPAQEDLLPAVREAGRRGPVDVEVLSLDGARRLSSGHLAAIDGAIRPASGLVDLKAEVDNGEGSLYPNEAVTVRTLLQVLPRAVVVPDGAVQRGPDGLYAYVVDAAGKAKSRPVTVSHTAGGVSLVSRGLHAGETVVTDGQYRLEDGSPVAATAVRVDYAALLAATSPGGRP